MKRALNIVAIMLAVVAVWVSFNISTSTFSVIVAEDSSSSDSGETDFG